MIKLTKTRTFEGHSDPYLSRADEGPNIEVCIPGYELSQDMLEEAFQIFANAVMGYKVEVKVETVQ